MNRTGKKSFGPKKNRFVTKKNGPEQKKMIRTGKK